MTADTSEWKLRITMLCSSTVWAGTEKWSLRTAETLAAMGHDVTFIARKPLMFMERLSKPAPYKDGPGTLHFRPLPLVNDADLWSFYLLTSWLRRHADVLIATRVRDYWLGGLAAKLAGVPELLRLGVERKPREGYWRDRLRYGTLPSAIMVNAHAIKDILATSPLIDPDTVHVIYNGVETPGRGGDEIRTGVRTELGLAEGEIFVLGAGRLATEKRWHWVIEAAVELRKRGIPVQAYVFGHGNENASLMNRVAELNAGDFVKFPGLTAHLDRYLGAADVAVMSSRTEGVSNSMLEALGRGVATLATSAGGAAEKLVSGRDLILVGNDDQAEFVDQLETLCRDAELRAKLGAQGLETVRKEFSWERMGRELNEVLQGLVRANEG